MAGDTTIRPARLADAAGLCQLLRDIGWFHAFEDEAEEQSLARVQRHLELCLAEDSHSIYVAEQIIDGSLVGYTAVHWLPYLILAGPEGYVSELFLSEATRGHGVGAQLLAAVKEEALQRGCVRLSLLNMRTRESYRRGFYVKHGWEERADAANMVLKLH
jgi:GNAT superfamily N-acetyltransferase